MTALRWIGLNDQITEVPAMRCVWCTVHHWLTEADRIRSEAGAPTSHGMCDRASAKMLAELDLPAA